MKKLLAFVFCLSLAAGVSLGQVACSHNPPVLSPGASTALTNGLTALRAILAAKGASPVILAAISDAQVAIAQDVSGQSWGQITRTLLTELYEQIPASLQSQPVVWASLAAVEIVLATIGA